MSTNIFHSAVLKTTALYLVIIVLISVIFSIGLYRVSSQEIERGIGAQIGPIRHRLAISNNQDFLDELIIKQNLAVIEAQNRLKANLITLNIMIFISGGLLSYFLARKTLEPIEKAHKAQSRFTADASHELRTPITAMRVETELTLTEPKLTIKKAKQQLESNIEELDKLTMLSEGLLQIARVNEDGLDTKSVKLEEILDMAISRVSKKAEQKSQLIVNDNNLKIKLEANKLSIVEALVTILDNAIKYSADKSEIKILTKHNKTYIDIQIVDKGVGIRDIDLPHVFDRFYRADSSRTKNKTSGYGIGLSIAQSVAKAHGGNVTATSKVGLGSTFTMSLPLS